MPVAEKSSAEAVLESVGNLDWENPVLGHPVLLLLTSLGPHTLCLKEKWRKEWPDADQQPGSIGVPGSWASLTSGLSRLFYKLIQSPMSPSVLSHQDVLRAS